MKYPKLTKTEIEVIKQAKEGDEQAFNSIFHKYKQFVDDLLFTYIKDRDEACDLTNIVFVKVHEKLKLFTEYNTFIGWLKILSKNVAIDYLRLHKKKDSVEKDFDITQNYESVTCDPINHMLVNEILKYIKLNFPPGHDKVFELVLEGTPYPQIAKQLKIPVNTIKSIMHRLRPKLKKTFNF